MNYQTICKKEYKLPLIGKWYKPKDLDLYTCDISVPALNLNYMLVFAKIDEFAKYVKKRCDYKVQNVENANALYVYINENGNNDKYIVFTEYDWTAKDYGTICHELHHAVHSALDDIGISYGQAGEEVYAYLQGHLMELVVRAFMELHKEVSKKPTKKRK